MGMLGNECVCVCVTCVIMFRNNLSWHTVAHNLCLWFSLVCTFDVPGMHNYAHAWPSISVFHWPVCRYVCVCVMCMCLCVYSSNQMRVWRWVWLAPFSFGSPALRGNIPHSLVWRPLERKWGRQLSDLPPPLPLHLSQALSISSSPHNHPPPSLCVFTVLTIKPWPWVFRGPNWADCWRWLWWMEGGWSQGPLWMILSSVCPDLLRKKRMEQIGREDSKLSQGRLTSSYRPVTTVVP